MSNKTFTLTYKVALYFNVQKEVKLKQSSLVKISFRHTSNRKTQTGKCWQFSIVEGFCDALQKLFVVTHTLYGLAICYNSHKQVNIVKKS